MNLEQYLEKASKGLEPKDRPAFKSDARFGFNHAVSEFKDLLKANPKSTAEQILKNLEEIK